MSYIPQIFIIIIARVSSTVPIMSSQLDFKLRFLQHISTDAIQITSDAVAMGEWGPHSHKHKLNMADFILNMPLRFFARVFGNPAGDPVLLKSRGVTLLRDTPGQASFLLLFFLTYSKCSVIC